MVARYFLGVAFKLGDPIGACPLLKTSGDSGYNAANQVFDQY